MQTSGGRKILYKDDMGYQAILKEGDLVKIDNAEDPESITVKIEVAEPAYSTRL